jgi:hypothetical protein
MAMPDWKRLAHFLYGHGFWYAHPLGEIDGLSEEQLLWVPEPNALCALWEAAHTAHRERVHIGHFIEGLPIGGLIPDQYEVFGPEWASVEQVRASIDSVEAVVDWARDVRLRTHEVIDELTEADLDLPSAAGGDEPLSKGHWLFITVSHTALHIGRIQLLRALIEGTPARAC